MKISLASPPIPQGLNDGLHWVDLLTKKASEEQAEIICFPESFLPGYPGMPFLEEDRDKEGLISALSKVCEMALRYSVSIIIPMDWYLGDKLINVAHVISSKGEILGYQAKVQLDPSEDDIWLAGQKREIFEINGLKFGISICHEGFRYPETVRWAARHGAKIVFHPHFAGSNTHGNKLTEWGAKENPYYEKAMQMRALENTIYFASSNYASTYAESASAIISPEGDCIIHEKYGTVGIITADIIPEKATGFLAKRFKKIE